MGAERDWEREHYAAAWRWIRFWKRALNYASFSFGALLLFDVLVVKEGLPRLLMPAWLLVLLYCSDERSRAICPRCGRGYYRKNLLRLLEHDRKGCFHCGLPYGTMGDPDADQ